MIQDVSGRAAKVSTTRGTRDERSCPCGRTGHAVAIFTTSMSQPSSLGSNGQARTAKQSRDRLGNAGLNECRDAARTFPLPRLALGASWRKNAMTGVADMGEIDRKRVAAVKVLEPWAIASTA